MAEYLDTNQGKVCTHGTEKGFRIRFNVATVIVCDVSRLKSTPHQLRTFLMENMPVE